MKTADTISLASTQAIDTLGIDTLSAVLPDTIAEELNPFNEYGFFHDDSLVHAEVPYRPFGFEATATPFRLRNEAWSGVLLLVCLLLAAGIVLRLKKKFRKLLRDVFLPIPGKTDELILDDPLRYSTRLMAVCLLSFAAAIVTFVLTQSQVSYYPFRETPYLLFAAFFVLWIVYFLAKRMLGSFINWIFFRRGKIFTWKRVYTFLLAAEAMLFLVLALVVMYLPVTSSEVQLLVLIPIIFVKIVLLFKTYQIFFPKMYGTLHLIVYFCTLELIPLLVLQRVLTYAEWLTTIKL